MREKTSAERAIMKPSAAKQCGCKSVRHQCGLIVNERTKANREFPCVRNMNCCFVRCADINAGVRPPSALNPYNYRAITSVGGCPYGWSFRKGGCYRVFGADTPKWSDAREECRKIGADLVKITSEAENTFVVALARKWAPEREKM